MKGLLTYRTFQFSMSSVPQERNKILRLLTVTVGYCRLPSGYSNVTAFELSQTLTAQLMLSRFAMNLALTSLPFGDKKSESRFLLTRHLRPRLSSQSIYPIASTVSKDFFDFFSAGVAEGQPEKNFKSTRRPRNAHYHTLSYRPATKLTKNVHRQ